MRNLFGFATLLIAFFLVACDGEPAFVGSGPTPTPLSTGTGGTGGTGAVFMGSGTGASYVDGAIGVSVPAGQMLSAGGNASLTVNFVDSNNNLVGDEATVTFTSACVAAGLASISESPIMTVTGGATVTYAATGCAVADTITATANVDGTVLTATGTITVAAATVGSIVFVSADPTNIGLEGTGGAGRQETSTVRFKVTDSTGGPVSGSTVAFTLNPDGAATIPPPGTATSDAQGIVQTVVSAGSVQTSVRVTATVTALGISTQSDQLTITTGIPDQDSVSLSMECVNVEGWNRDGETTEVTVRLSDRYNNPVPDGTAVTFSAEGGQIGGSCLTETTPGGGGVCSVTWVSQQPRPADGRVSIIATAIGEESFVDIDGNGRFNDPEVETSLGEPFRDDNESGAYDTGEVFGDFNSNAMWDDGTALEAQLEGLLDYVGFNGLLCDELVPPAVPPICNTINKTLFVSDQGVIVMSSGAAIITDSGAVVVAAGTENVASFTVTVGDVNGNPLTAGTTVKAETSNGSMVGKDSYTLQCDNSNVSTVFDFAVKGDGTTSSGLITIEVTSPSGVPTIRTITFDD